MRIMTVGVAFPDLPFPVVDEKLGLVFNGLLTAKGDRILLGIKDLGRLTVALSFNGPIAAVGNDVLILLCHECIS